MGKWEQHAFFKTEVWEAGNPSITSFVFRPGSEEQAAKAIAAHNADCDAYEAKIAKLETKLEEYEHASGAGHPQPCTLGPLCPYCHIAELEAQCIAERQQAAAHYQACLAAQSRLARIAALVKPIPVADLVEAGTEAPALLADRQRQIRAILEEDR